MTQVKLASLELELLKIGDTGMDVSHLQKVLASHGFYQGSINGIFGIQTEKAVLDLQQCLGLEQNGTFNEATWYGLSFWSGDLEKYEAKTTEFLPGLNSIKDKFVTALKFRGREYSSPQAITPNGDLKGLKFRGTSY